MNSRALGDARAWKSSGGSTNYVRHFKLNPQQKKSRKEIKKRYNDLKTEVLVSIELRKWWDAFSEPTPMNGRLVSPECFLSIYKTVKNILPPPVTRSQKRIMKSGVIVAPVNKEVFTAEILDVAYAYARTDEVVEVVNMMRKLLPHAIKDNAKRVRLESDVLQGRSVSPLRMPVSSGVGTASAPTIFLQRDIKYIQACRSTRQMRADSRLANDQLGTPASLFRRSMTRPSSTLSGGGSLNGSASAPSFPNQRSSTAPLHPGMRPHPGTSKHTASGSKTAGPTYKRSNYHNVKTQHVDTVVYDYNEAATQGPHANKEGSYSAFFPNITRLDVDIAVPLFAIPDKGRTPSLVSMHKLGQDNVAKHVYRGS